MIILLENFDQKRRNLILDESDVMTVLKVLSEITQESRFHILMNMEIGNCGWADEPKAWFIHYNATTKQWKSAIEKLGHMNYQIVLKHDERFHLIKKD